MLNKARIRKSFSRAASTYDASALLQRYVAVELSGLIKTSMDGGSVTALDIGCGTGSLAGHIKDLYPGGRVYGCDIALPMLLRARENSCDDNGRGIKGLVGADFEGLSFVSSAFDLVASNLAYQWAPDLSRAFTEAARVLKPGGLFAFTTLGAGTLRELRECYTEVFNGGRARFEPFKGAEDVASALDAAGLERVETKSTEVKRAYKDPLELLRALKKVGAFSRAFDNAKWGPSAGRVRSLKEVFALYRERFPSPHLPEGITATYDVIFALARKP